MDIKSAAKAHASENCLDDRNLVTDYYEPLLGESGSSASLVVTGSGSPNTTTSTLAASSTTSGSSSNATGRNAGSGGGYDRSSSHYFDRRSEPDGFLRRQAPVNHYRDRPYRSSNNGPFARDVSERSGGGSGNSSAGHYR